jgi:hypothetical protein
LSSTRRVKKGPGRRPQSAKRQRFMELRARGWSISGLDDLPGAAPQHHPGRHLQTVRGAPSRRGPPRSASPSSTGGQRRATRSGGRAARPAVEPAADRPPSAGSVLGAGGHAVVPREHLPSGLPARIYARAAGASALGASLCATEWARSSASPAAGRAAPATVRSADAVDSSAAVRAE